MRFRVFRMHGDRGQALPVYLTVIGGLLFLAFAYFAVGQAAATRNGAQTAADAAALAAAQDTRDQLHDALLDAFRSGRLDNLAALLDGQFSVPQDPCRKAGDFAADNRARTTGCTQSGDGYRVDVETDYTVGRSVVPGTEKKRAHASATAEIRPLCRWQSALPSPAPTPTSTGTPTPTPTGTPTSTGTPSPAPSGTPSPGTLLCEGRNWVVDPSDLTLFPSAADLFSVHLTD